MGRLFWKVFFGFWLTMLIAAAIAALGVYAAKEDEDFASGAVSDDKIGLYANRWVDERLRRYATVLEFSGVPALERLLKQDAQARANRQPRSDRLRPRRYRPPMLVVNDQGQDLLDRTVPKRSLRLAKRRTARAANNKPMTQTVDAPGAIRVRLADDANWWLFMPRTDASGRRPPHRSLMGQLSPTGAGALALAFSLLFSGALAWYLARPIRILRDGFRQVSSGQLDTRVSALMGKRRDELADLGQDFDKTTARLQHLIESQRRLLHDVSHELRSPLARIQAAIGLLDQSPDRAAELSARIESESQRLDQLVGEILTLARLDEHEYVLPDTPFDINDLLADLLADARFEAHAVEKEVTLTGEISTDIAGDPTLVHRACENLVRNAIRYSPVHGSVQITASERPSPNGSGRQICIEVCDRGPGLSEAELISVIEPFARGQQASVDGFGLGLAIARRAITIHRGSLSLNNRSGGGLCAKLIWPAIGTD